ncbi:Osmolarity sensor protein EnvZ [Rickettsiales bacterium Ac37b]|nr:Osmolarity sensor protein EnvZ [Rickettsiales bacterium Ac37b]
MYKTIKFLRDRLIPDTLLARLLMILVIPTALTQIVAAYIFYERHWSDVSEKILNSIAGDVVMVAHFMENSEFLDREKIITLAHDNMRLDIQYRLGKMNIRSGYKGEEKLSLLYTVITNRLKKKTNIEYANITGDIKVTIQLSRGYIIVNIPNKRFSTPTTYIFILWMTGTAFILTVIATIFCRNQVRSITKLSKVADDFGKGFKSSYFKPTGALEVRRAGGAFLQMQERIIRQINQRTEMLAGVSHDLRTPLTRMKLQLAMLEPSQEIRELEHDINDMEYMIQHYIDFVQGEGTEKVQYVCISDLLIQIVNFYNVQKISVISNIEANIMINLKVNIFKRAIINVIENSVLYAKNQVKISLMTLKEELIITIEDDGPGIPADKRDMVFKPFYRLDHSRNLNINGVGLGLSIVREAVNGHGGQIELTDSESLHGLKTIITLPL